jgi:hypothetical protein
VRSANRVWAFPQKLKRAATISRFSKISFLKFLTAEKREIVAARFSFLAKCPYPIGAPRALRRLKCHSLGYGFSVPARTDCAHTGVRRGTQGYTGVLYTGVRSGTGVHRGTQGYTGVHTSIQEYTGVHRGTQGYTGVYTGTQRYTGVHRGTQGYTGVHTVGVHSA